MNKEQTISKLIELGIDLKKAKGFDLRYANLRWADLSGADLSGANLSRANLSGAKLAYTMLDSVLTSRNRKFFSNCKPAGKNGGRIVWRSSRSKYNGNTEYLPGKTYIAPFLSHDPLISCHPGIYACDTKEMALSWSNKIVRCYVRDGDYVIVDKGIRCERLRVLDYG